jgi:hypothetical protein
MTYIQQLEQRLAQMESLLQNVRILSRYASIPLLKDISNNTSLYETSGLQTPHLLQHHYPALCHSLYRRLLLSCLLSPKMLTRLSLLTTSH